MRDLDLTTPDLLDASLVVSASAGSGKTFTLTVLVCACLGRAELRAYEVLATTFSEAAAADLRERLLRPLDLLAALGPGDWRGLLAALAEGNADDFAVRLEAFESSERLRRAVPELVQASRLWGRPDWSLSPEKAQAFWRRTRREAELLQVSTIHSLALSLMAGGEGAPESIRDATHPALLRVLRQAMRETLARPEGDPDHPAARALLAWAESNWEALSAGHDGHRDALGHLEARATAPCRERFLEALGAAERAFAPFARDPESARDLASPSRRFFRTSAILPLEPAAPLARRLAWAARQSEAVSAKDGELPGYYTAAFGEAYRSLEPLADAWEAWLGALLVQGLRAFEALKAEHGLATFGDLVRAALQGLERGGLDAPRPRLLLVDEFQDTSRAQDAFLAALGAERAVRVGDLKQAIYGFRGGDPGLLREALRAAGPFAFRLPRNFRSAPPVVALANRYVDELWPSLDPSAAPLDGRQEARGSGGCPVGLVRTEAPRSGTDLPALADWIAALSLPKGWDAVLGQGGGPPARTRALLLRQRTKLPALLRRLKTKGVQPYVVAKEGFWDSPGVRLLMAALEAVAHPNRPAPCAALLRHVAGLGDGELSDLARSAEGRPRLPGLGALDPSRVPASRREAVQALLALRGMETLEVAGWMLREGALLRLVAALEVHGALEPLRARRNLAALLAELLELPAHPAAAFAALEEARRGRERGDLPASAASADLVIQTVHASKGLEYDDVALPLLNGQPRPFRKGELRTDPETKALAFAWKLGRHPGAAYRLLKPLVEAAQRRDDLNLLYVALTRARERLCLLLQAPKEAKEPPESRTWAQWGLHLAECHDAWARLDAPPEVAPPGRPSPPALEVLPLRSLPSVPVREDAGGASPEARVRARAEGEAMHAFLRDLLVRWEDEAAFRACLEAAPAVPRAREMATAFLSAFEARGWRHRRRRAELPLEGAAASGATGRADLVVWEGPRLQLLDFKLSRDFGAEELETYTLQLGRYARALEAMEGLPVQAWLIALRSGAWVPVPVS